MILLEKDQDNFVSVKIPLSLWPQLLLNKSTGSSQTTTAAVVAAATAAAALQVSMLDASKQKLLHPYEKVSFETKSTYDALTCQKL